ncbi:MAG: hypothetical protein ACLFWF_07995 [Alphaproteobacteria bacterium]
MARRIYLASSWRNSEQPRIVATLREAGHAVYDFRNPAKGVTGLSWSEIDPEWKSWTADEYRRALEHPVAVQGFKLDYEAMKWCDTCVLLLPCGRSAHLEAGWCAAAGKHTIVLTRDGEEPELMALLAHHICVSEIELLDVLAEDRSTGGLNYA